MKVRQIVVLFGLFHVVCLPVLSQVVSDSTPKGVAVLTRKYIRSAEGKAEDIAADIDKKTEKYLRKLEKQENVLQAKLASIDSVAAVKIFADAKSQYNTIRNKLTGKSAELVKNTGNYSPWLDSASTTLNFLSASNLLAGSIASDAGKVNAALSKMKELAVQLKHASTVKDFIRQRKETLAAQLKNYSLGNDLKKYNQTAYYYAQQINEYRAMLNEPDKAARKALELLNKLPSFQNFIQKNSILASMFNTSGNTADLSTIAGDLMGLQTRNSVQQIIQNQLAIGGNNAQAILQGNLQEAQGMMGQLKNKLAKYGSSGSSDLDVPSYAPNPHKTKRFLQRIEFGTNIQSTKNSYAFPMTTDIALSAGYKLNDKSVIGIGASYKIGWGKDIKHIAISSQGMGLRSFVDVKLKGSFYASGGLEYNYQPVTLASFHPLSGWDDWTKSGLIGISKIISLKSKYFKKTKIQLLWDLLSYQQIPQTSPFKFRVGYNF